MADTFNLTATLDATSYVTGSTMTLTVAGTVAGVTSSTDTITITITASDGTTTTLTLPATITSASTPSWKITAVTDSGGRAWTVGTTGTTATATA